MKSEFNYKWSKIFAAKRFNENGTGEITLSLQEQIELLEDSENSLQTVGNDNVSETKKLLSQFTVVSVKIGGEELFKRKCKGCGTIIHKEGHDELEKHRLICVKPVSLDIPESFFNGFVRVEVIKPSGEKNLRWQCIKCYDILDNGGSDVEKHLKSCCK